MIILGIETSCDETAAAVVRGVGNKVEVLSNVVSSQIEIHKKYGGVVPEVAAREHVLNILPVINEALEKAGIKSPRQCGERAYPPLPVLSVAEGLKVVNKVDAIAVTVGPGLVTSLLVGVETAKTLAYAWRLPVVAVNHIEGHIYANWLKPIGNVKCQMSNVKNDIKFPALVLTVSGGHTMLVLMTGHGKYKVLGETRDDAAGEAFDKAAQLLGLGYPGGPAIAEQARKFKIPRLAEDGESRRANPNNQTNYKLQTLNSKQTQNAKKIILPRPMINSGDFDFSFSGLKTALFYQLQRNKKWPEKISEYAAEFQQAAVEVLVAKTIKAAKSLNCQIVMLSGGVAANLELRRQLETSIREKLIGAKLIIPELKYCTDNAVMIATAGYYRAQRKKFTLWQKLKTEPNKELV